MSYCHPKWKTLLGIYLLRSIRTDLQIIIRFDLGILIIYRIDVCSHNDSALFMAAETVEGFYLMQKEIFYKLDTFY